MINFILIFPFLKNENNVLINIIYKFFKKKNNERYRKNNLKRNKINDNVIKKFCELKNFANYYLESRFEISFRFLKNHFYCFKN